MASALPSQALMDVQRYLRQKKATGAAVTPQDERSAWGGYFDAMAARNLQERQLSAQIKQDEDRTKLMEQQQKAQEQAATYSGLGQLVQTGGTLAYGLKGTDIGAKIGLGNSPSAPTATTPTPATTGTPGAQQAISNVPAAPTTASMTPATTGAMTATEATNVLNAAGGMAPEASTSAALEGTGIFSAASPYLGPVGVGLAAGSMAPKLLGVKSEEGQMAVGAGAGAVSGAITGAMMSAPTGPGAIVGGIIGAVAGGVGSKVK